MINYLERGVVGALLLCGALTLMLIANSNHLPKASSQTLRPGSGGPIHGYVGAALLSHNQLSVASSAANYVTLINVPDIEVFAKNVKTGATSERTKTNPQGYFRTPPVAAGSYQICVSGAGYLDSCDPRPIDVHSSIRALEYTVPIEPTPRALTGTVSLADQVTPCFWFRPAFDTSSVLVATVALLDAGGNIVAGPVKGNTLGQFVLPISASNGSFKLRARCEGAESEREVSLPGPLQQNMLIRNNPPQDVWIELAKGGTGVRRADPGDVLRATVKAKDLDGDTLHYRWTDDSGRNLGLPDAASVDWPVINGPSLNTLRVQVFDGKGGFAVADRSLRAGPNEILFSGRVFNRLNHAPIDHAQVSLNNVVGQTDAAGHFKVTVPDAPRFVLNINKAGFALSSRVYSGRNTGLQIPLDPTQQVTFHADKVCQVVISPNDCDRKCKSKGDLSIHIEPGSLVDASGTPYTGVATFEGFQYDISLPNPIPGDQGAVYQGKTVRLATFGAFYLQPRDALGQPLKMAPNKKMDVSMPIDPEVLAKAPATIPFFRYEEATGMWTEHGTLTRAGNKYVGEVKHFSAFNADTQFGGSACVKVILNGFPAQVSLDASYVEPSSGQFYHNGSPATDPIVGIERMTPNVNFTLEIWDAPHTTRLKSVTLNSGAPLDATAFADGWVPEPFNECNGPITIYNSNVPTGPTYLMPVPRFSIPFGPMEDNSAAYREATDANAMSGGRRTFTLWKGVNGFPDVNDAHAIYFNNGDLQFGRDMHCRVTSSGTTACYVSNYGNVGEEYSNGVLDPARSGSMPVATVAMEYDPAATNDEKVQFWAYGPTGEYIQKAKLDGQGAKPLPSLCLACHGGFLDPAVSTKVRKAAFLPFDLDSFLYDDEGNPHSGFTNATSVQAQFNRLNFLVLNTNPDGQSGNMNTPIANLINIWYPGAGGVTNPASPFLLDQPNQASHFDFAGHQPLYNDVVKPLCRTCHMTRNSGQDWTSYSTQMFPLRSFIQSFACGTSPHQTQNFAMPHAEVPFKVFWRALNPPSSTLGSELLPTLGGCPNN